MFVGDGGRVMTISDKQDRDLKGDVINIAENYTL